MIDGFEVRDSHFDQSETISRLIHSFEAHQVSVFARVDHAAAAAAVGLTLAPTEVFIVGNPKAGTALMQASQTAGVDLPLKFLVWTDASQKTRVGYESPRWLAARHGIAAQAGERAEMLARGLQVIATEAAGG